MDIVEEVAPKISISSSRQNTVLIMEIPLIQTTERICSHREDFTKDILVIKYHFFCKIMYDIEGSSKLISVALVLMFRIMDKLS